MHLLVTNDDGVQAPGLLALAQALRPIGQVTVFAPDRNWTASGHVKTLDRPLRVREVQLADGSPAFSTDGAPSDCVAMALLGAIAAPIDFVVSGINPGENIGHDLTYSGTVTAAMEATIFGLPGLAVSLQMPAQPPRHPDFSPAAKAAFHLVSELLRQPLPPGVFLNANVPNRPAAEIKGFRVTRQGLRVYKDELVRRLDPRGRPYYWIGGEMPGGMPEEGTDFSALMDGYISITPVQLDLTARECLTPLSARAWPWTVEDRQG